MFRVGEQVARLVYCFAKVLLVLDKKIVQGEVPLVQALQHRCANRGVKMPESSTLYVRIQAPLLHTDAISRRISRQQIRSVITSIVPVVSFAFFGRVEVATLYPSRVWRDDGVVLAR